MKPHLPLVVSVFVLIVGFSGGTAFAQTPPAAPSPGAGQGGGMTSSLSKDDMARLMKARQQALADNPDLKTEQDALSKQRQAIKNDPDATAEDKMVFAQSMMEHQQKMKAAMLKIDPTLAPVLDQLDQQMKQRMQARAQAAGGN